MTEFNFPKKYFVYFKSIKSATLNRKYLHFLFFIFTLLSSTLFAQQGFKFIGANQKTQSIRFQLVNNLIVIPIDVNGKQLSFILDSGVDKTILFNISKSDSLDIGLKNIKRITLQGLGDGLPVEALLSKKNKMKIRDFVSEDEGIYVILNDKFDVSGRMGVTVHGIIGNQLLKNAIVGINYKTKRIDFFNPKTFTYGKCRKCSVFPLQFYRNKPYLDAKVQLDTIGKKLTDVKLLVDTGGSDSIWLFEGTKEEIRTPKKYFKDILGEGLSGTIYGNKSRIKGLQLDKFHFKNPTVSFLDSTSTLFARQFKLRNGSVGGNILRRFKIWFDYPNKKITLKKNASFFGGFEYNMSGISLVYNGKILVKELAVTKLGEFGIDKTREAGAFTLISSYKFRFKPSYKIDKILVDSPGALAGLLPGDVILSINRVRTHQFTLKQIMGKFQERSGKKIRLEVERNLKKLKFEFKLLKRI